MNTPTVQTNRLENYLNHLLEQCQANSPLIDADYLHTLRKNAVSQVQELTLPKKRMKSGGLLISPNCMS
ncbi:Iron-sulfur cluster assembly protein SufD [Crocosphaera watsonii WH 0005]|uniref:Iron-sulfur cluster assembly protein SufD n=1 Tax=Crocosphaera watsonii WH 0005 TaxID=423472 RepID=T2IXT8_CROWT|nr:hypothetical protein [Crocosphaera watsonii]CCQ58471.1 Iron-sulfur cluster assembly protein SufD [Crocosphaera watsonii WH 0005]